MRSRRRIGEVERQAPCNEVSFELSDRLHANCLPFRNGLYHLCAKLARHQIRFSSLPSRALSIRQSRIEY
jgi:hypothetical protein